MVSVYYQIADLSVAKQQARQPKPELPNSLESEAALPRPPVSKGPEDLRYLKRKSKPIKGRRKGAHKRFYKFTLLSRLTQWIGKTNQHANEYIGNCMQSFAKAVQQIMPQ